MERNPATIADMTPVQAKVAVTVRELSAENQRLHRALDEAIELMKWARGHYGIEECAGIAQDPTEWDDIQHEMLMFTARWRPDAS
jgi:hypothetical protein